MEELNNLTIPALWGFAFTVIIVMGFRFAKEVRRIIRTPNPRPGEKWLFCDNEGSPWAKNEYRPVSILEVKDGWVTYDLLGSSHLSLYQFKWMYRKVDD